MSLYLGFDLSTQQLKIVSCYEDLSFHSKFTINFDEFKGKYNIKKGVISNDKTGEVLTPVLLFIDAFQTLLDRMKESNFPFFKVKSISGSCQQHGTVYYKENIFEKLNNLNFESNEWSEDLKDGFSFSNASNWQDRSTIQESKDFENALGNANKLCEITGSKAHYRFSGLQIRKRARINNKEWQNTSFIGLISSLLDSLLTSKLRGIEIGEACGTNLFDIKLNDWNDELLSLIMMKNCKIDKVSKTEEIESSKIARKMLIKILKPNESSKIANYLVKRYGFNEECLIWPITGDNLATIMSLPLQRNDLLISMGTSTTVLLLTEKYLPSINYHLFKHPVCSNIYMGMLCYCNGSLAREQIRDKINEKYNIEFNKWDKFNEILSNNENNEKIKNEIGIYFPLGEIIPNVKPCIKKFKFQEDSNNNNNNNQLIELKNVSIEEDVKLIIESQALSCRLRVCPLLSKESYFNNNNLNDKEISKINELEEIVGENVNVDNVKYDFKEFDKMPNNNYYVGGGSQNNEIVKKFNNILGCKGKGFKVENSDACALGGCFRAIWGNTGNGIEFEEWIKSKYKFAKQVEEINTDEKDQDKFTIWNDYFKKLGMLSLCESQLDKE